MHVQRRPREIVALVEIVGEPLRQIARVVIVHIDQRGDTGPRAGDLKRGLLQSGAGKVTQGLRAIVIAARPHVAVKLLVELVVDGDRHAASLSPRWRRHHSIAARYFGVNSGGTSSTLNKFVAFMTAS